MDKKYIGDAGEDFAADILKQKGYLILDRNYSTKTGEIDIIAKQGETFVFIEVKTRRNNIYGNPGEFVDFRKQRKIQLSALYYLKSDAFDMRFDIFEVIYEIKNGEFLVSEYNHIENAF